MLPFTDQQPPTVVSCPGDIYIFEDETPTFEYPTFNDNVGIAAKHEPNMDDRFSEGVYHKQFSVEDYDGNLATCYFRIVVSSRGECVGFSHV